MNLHKIIIGLLAILLLISGIQIKNLQAKAEIKSKIIYIQPAPRVKNKKEKILIDYSINKYSAQYKVDPKLIHAIIKMESGYNPTAVSPEDAAGLMQLAPRTARGLGCTNPFDIEQNIKAGTKHVAGLLARYKGNVKLALAAYNAGGNAVSRYGGIPPYKETRNYVINVMQYRKKLIMQGGY